MFLLAGAVFGALLSLFMSGGYETVAMVLCEVRQFVFFFFLWCGLEACLLVFFGCGCAIVIGVSWSVFRV